MSTPEMTPNQHVYRSTDICTTTHLTCAIPFYTADIFAGDGNKYGNSLAALERQVCRHNVDRQVRLHVRTSGYESDDLTV